MLHKDYVLLARQPLYDAKSRCVGYEVFFRNEFNMSAKCVGGDIATKQVLLNYFAGSSNVALDAIGASSDRLPVFLNVDPTFVMEQDSLPVSPELLIVELTSLVSWTPTLLQSIARWKKQGFRFALDGFAFQRDFEPLMALMDFIKIDMQVVGRKTLDSANLGQWGFSGIWVAERIENAEEYELCKRKGFEWFQGFYLQKPQPIMGSSIHPSVERVIRIVEAIESGSSTVDQVVSLVAQDPKLSFQLLRIVNSSMFKLPAPVESLKAAVVYLGLNLLKRWALLIAFLSNGVACTEVCRLILLRAKACELMSRQRGADSASVNTSFMVGLISGVDLLLRVEPEVFIRQIKLSDVVGRAVLHHEGEAGAVLADVLALQKDIAMKRQFLEQAPAHLLTVYAEAFEWSTNVMLSIESA